jgi:hypothetical protein
LEINVISILSIPKVYENIQIEVSIDWKSPNIWNSLISGIVYPGKCAVLRGRPRTYKEGKVGVRCCYIFARNSTEKKMQIYLIMYIKLEKEMHH